MRGGLGATAQERPPAPGTGAERMGMTWLTGALPSEAGYYQPRHRSTRQGETQIDQHDPVLQDHLPELPGRPDLPGRPAGPGPASRVSPLSETSEATDDQTGECFLDQLTAGEVRRILEGCALHDLSRAVPELVQHIAHSSHTPATISKAWSEFEEATRDLYALHLRGDDRSAVFRGTQQSLCPDQEMAAIVRDYADHAWQLITRGPLGCPAKASA